MSKLNFNWSQVLKAVGTLIISIISAITITSWAPLPPVGGIDSTQGID